jgi:hypothetical protein
MTDDSSCEARATVGLLVQSRQRRTQVTVDDVLAAAPPRDAWRMPPLATLVKPVMSTQRKLGLMTLRGYLLIAFVLVVVRIVQLALN